MKHLSFFLLIYDIRHNYYQLDSSHIYIVQQSPCNHMSGVWPCHCLIRIGKSWLAWLAFRGLIQSSCILTVFSEQQLPFRIPCEYSQYILYSKRQESISSSPCVNIHISPFIIGTVVTGLSRGNSLTIRNSRRVTPFSIDLFLNCQQ